MQPQAQEFFDKVLATKFFENIGQPIDSEDIEQCTSWKEALQHAGSQQFEDFRIDRHNEVVKKMPRMTVGDELDTRYQNYLDEVEKVSDTVYAKWDSLDLPIPKMKKVQLVFYDFFAGVAVALEFPNWRDDSSIYSEMMDWFFKGHFPCGWTCEWPQGEPRVGKPIIF